MHTVWLRYYLVDCKYSQQETFMGSLASAWSIELSAGIWRLEMRKTQLKRIVEKLEKDPLPYLWGSWENLYKDHLVWYIWTMYHIWTDIHAWTDHGQKWLDYKTRKSQIRPCFLLVSFSETPCLWFSCGIEIDVDTQNDRGKCADSGMEA